MKKITLLILSILLISCAIEIEKKKKKQDEKISTHTSRKIIGRNDFVVVNSEGSNIPSKYSLIIDAVGKITTEFMGGCTGVHIGDGIVVSAGHCFAGLPNDVRGHDCPGTVVKFGLRKNKLNYFTAKCIRILSYQHSEDIDYSIFKVDPIPPTKVDFNIDNRPELGTPITIFSHPKGRRLEWSKLCSVESSEDDQKLGENHFYHNCDSEPASSGAPIFDDNTLEFIGIHNGSRYMLPWNYGSFLFDSPLRDLL